MDTNVPITESWCRPYDVDPVRASFISIRFDYLFRIFLRISRASKAISITAIYIPNSLQLTSRTVLTLLL